MQVKEFEQEVVVLKQKIFRFAKRLLSFTADAEDLTQEVLIKLWNKRESLKEYRSVEALAMTMTRNQCVDRLRAKNYNRVELKQDSAVHHDTPLKVVESKSQMQMMHQIIEQLPEQQKMIVQLRDIEAYPYEEIAEIMDMSIATVRTNLSRARKKLRIEITKVIEHEYGRVENPA